MIIKIKSFVIRLLNAFICSVRPALGPSGTCIYPVTCTQYANDVLTHRPIYIALPLIFMRIISCNPITALIRKYKSKKTSP